MLSGSRFGGIVTPKKIFINCILKIKPMNYFTETDECCICTDCKKEFKAYHYYEDCPCCHDGETDDGSECAACSGMGDHNSIEKKTCQLCLYKFLTNDE